MGVKEAVRKRDGYRCTRCGMTNDEHKAVTGRALEVHRLTPASAYTLEGCTTLCQRCHDTTPGGAYVRHWQNYDGSVRVLRVDPQAKAPTLATRTRRAARWSRSVLSRHTGIPGHRLRQWEEGNAELTETEVLLIAGALGVPVAELPVCGSQLPHQRILASSSDWAFDL
jgi:hypothetical protein